MNIKKAQAHEWNNDNKDGNTDLPLPPPPSPTLLQQLEIDSQCSGCTDDNTTDTKQQLLHIRTNSNLSTLSTTSNSSSMSSAAISTHIPAPVEGTPTTAMVESITVDEKSSGYASVSPLHSRQTSSSASSVCGMNRDSNRTPLVPPPPPPPLPSFLQAQTVQQPHRQQNENDMNSQNQDGSGGDLAGSGVVSKHSLPGGVYSKFLKEYSNKLLTQNNNNNTSTNSLYPDIIPKHSPHSKKSNTVTNSSQYRLNETALPHQPSTQTLVVAYPQSVQTSFSGLTSTGTAAGAVTAATKTTHPPVFAATSATLANQLNFNPCQQVAKTTTASTVPPQALPSTTATSATIAKASLLDTINREQLSESESIHDTAKEVTSTMLANQSPTLDQSVDDQPFGEYVTLTGSVIRSVVPPGKGVNLNYKINHGYARPFGAASGASAAAPKSPVSYASQRPAVNPYATLPRTNIGQQGYAYY